MEASFTKSSRKETLKTANAMRQTHVQTNSSHHLLNNANKRVSKVRYIKERVKKDKSKDSQGVSLKVRSCIISIALEGDKQTPVRYLQS